MGTGGRARLRHTPHPHPQWLQSTPAPHYASGRAPLCPSLPITGNIGNCPAPSSPRELLRVLTTHCSHPHCDSYLTIPLSPDCLLYWLCYRDSCEFRSAHLQGAGGKVGNRQTDRPLRYAEGKDILRKSAGPAAARLLHVHMTDSPLHP